jgi:hypothetical protein
MTRGEAIRSAMFAVLPRRVRARIRARRIQQLQRARKFDLYLRSVTTSTVVALVNPELKKLEESLAIAVELLQRDDRRKTEDREAVDRLMASLNEPE